MDRAGERLDCMISEKNVPLSVPEQGCSAGRMLPEEPLLGTAGKEGTRTGLTQKSTVIC